MEYFLCVSHPGGLYAPGLGSQVPSLLWGSRCGITHHEDGQHICPDSSGSLETKPPLTVTQHLFRNYEQFVGQLGSELRRKMELFIENSCNRLQDKIGLLNKTQDGGSYLKVPETCDSRTVRNIKV